VSALSTARSISPMRSRLRTTGEVMGHPAVALAGRRSDAAARPATPAQLRLALGGGIQDEAI
jgi:hypothetical protein